MADGGFCRGTAAGTQRVPHMGGQLHAWEPLGAASRISRAELPEASAIACTHASAPVHRYPRRRLLLAVRRAAHSRAASSAVERCATRLLAERAAPGCGRGRGRGRVCMAGTEAPPHRRG